ncbi:MAG: hypothetical protein L0Y57_13945 [Beijerinckiaceae bacterium]|nr:hypothetical protein [Beijerinckiaceae bacterium]
MGAETNFQNEPAGGHRGRKAVLIYRAFISRVFELGEIARMEMEILKSISPASAEPRCPNWHGCSSKEQQDSKHH